MCGRHLDFVQRGVLSVVIGGEIGNVRVVLPARKQTHLHTRRPCAIPVDGQPKKNRAGRAAFCYRSNIYTVLQAGLFAFHGDGDPL